MKGNIKGLTLIINLQLCSFTFTWAKQTQSRITLQETPSGGAMATLLVSLRQAVSQL